MIDHVSLHVADLEKSKAFYTAALAPLGYTVIVEYPGHTVGFGIAPKADLWLAPGGAHPTGQHVCIRASGRAAVRAFYEAALAAGGTDNGPPGVRPMYHPNYFGAFVRDPDGNNFEACCHEAYIE
jgi:catechol 2,3-dioxygenase-like lactoylglutathione lyase family enzyme